MAEDPCAVCLSAELTPNSPRPYKCRHPICHNCEREHHKNPAMKLCPTCRVGRKPPEKLMPIAKQRMAWCIDCGYIHIDDALKHWHECRLVEYLCHCRRYVTSDRPSFDKHLATHT
jgi:hypothetical protein